MASPEAALSAIDRSPGHPFDAVAERYDEDFSHRWLGRWYRDRVWELFQRSFYAGDRVLEFGCGTGEDARWLAGHGVYVTATDASPAMLSVTREKTFADGHAERVRLAHLDLNAIESAQDVWEALATTDPDRIPFDGVIANFGPLNCVANRPKLITALAGVVRPGSKVIVVVMGPLCPWEFVWHSLRLEPRTATRRLRSAAPGRIGDGGSIPVWYPSIGRLEAEFRPCFDAIDRVGLGLLLPPTGMARIADRVPGLFRRLGTVDTRLDRTRPWLWLNDHYALVMERRS
jgi:SAM-dependent methyltransferase